jgi:hypothetical protein
LAEVIKLQEVPEIMAMNNITMGIRAKVSDKKNKDKGSPKSSSNQQESGTRNGWWIGEQ